MLEQYHSLKCEEQFFSSNIINSPYRGLKFIFKLYLVGRRSVTAMASRCRLDGPCIESRYGRDFPHPSRPTVPTQWIPDHSLE